MLAYLFGKHSTTKPPPTSSSKRVFGPKSYESIREYLRLLLKQAEDNPQKVQIDGKVIDPERIRSVDHAKLAGLQVADPVASSLHFVVKASRYGETELGYLPRLKSRIYRHRGMALSASQALGLRVCAIR